MEHAMIEIQAFENGVWEIRVRVQKSENEVIEKGEAMQNLTRVSGCKGQGLVEYILVVFLMAILAIAAVRQLSNTTRNGFQKATERLQSEFGG